MIIYDEEKEAEFDFDWLTREDYQFKLLTLLAVLADNHLAFRGTLADMCEFLGVRSRNSRTNKKIREAIDSLESDGLLKKIIDGRTFTLTLSKKAEKQRCIIRIKNKWVMIAKNYADQPDKSESVSWENLLKVWLFILSYWNPNCLPVTDADIAEALHMTATTVRSARRALQDDLDAINSKKIYFSRICCRGSIHTPSAFVTDNRPEP